MKQWIFFAILWCGLLHRPALLSFGKAIPGSEEGDTLRGHWSTWFVAQDSTPFDTILCNWPAGASVLPLPPLSLLAISPITIILGAAYALSILIFMHSLLCVLGGYILGKALHFEKSTAIVLGIFLSAAPMLGETLSRGVYEYQTLGWTPLFFACLIHTCRGNWKYGPISALLYMILTLECGYYGSAAALGALVIAATHIRSVKGVLGGMLAAVAVGGLAYGSYTVIAPTLSKLSSGEIQAGGSFRVIMGRAELWALIPGIDPPPPPPGMPDPFVSAPPIMIWVLFFVAGIYSFRKSYWTSIMALFFLGVATQSPVLSWWSDGPLGSFIQNLRRFAAPMTLMMLCTIGYGWEHWKQSSRYIHKPRVFGVVLLVLLIWSAQDLLLRYPLLWTPKVPLIAQTITQDTNPGSVLVYPQEQEGRRATTHQYLRKDTSFSNPQARLWFQTLINRPMHHYTKLATLIPKSGRRWKLDGGTLSRIELEQMRTKGLRYVVVDNTQLSTQAQQQTKGLFTQLGYGCSDFDEWGGLTLCLLAQR